MITLCFALALLFLLLLRHPRCPPAPRPLSPPRSSSPAPSPIQHPRTSPRVDEFGRLPSNPSPARPPWSLPAKPRFSSSTLVDLDQLPSTSAPTQRRFTIPFRKHSRSRASSLPTTLASSEPSSPTSPPAPSAGRRTFAKKFKSIFKLSSESTVHSNAALKTIDIRPRRKSVRRTQPYGPPWNAPMPIVTPDSPRHSLQESAAPSHPTSRKQERTSSFSPTGLVKKILVLKQPSTRDIRDIEIS